MDLAVFGASGPTGRLVVGQALAAGHHVIAVTRKPDQYPLNSPHLDVVGADVTDACGVERVLATGAQAVISTFGVPYTRNPVTVYSRGVAAVVRAMTAQGVRRLVCVSSANVATEPEPGAPLLWRTAVRPLLRNVLGRTLYADMRRMEEIVQGSGLDWTIVRPAGLFDTARPTGDYEVAARRLPGRVTSRADLADTLVREAVAPQHPRATIEVMTRSATPPPFTFVKEALGIGGGPRSSAGTPA